MQPKAINYDTQPDKFMDSLLDSKAKFLTVGWITKSIEVDINKREEKVFLPVIRHHNRNDLDRYHTKEEEKQVRLMFEELKDPSSCPTCINLMCIH